MGFLEVVRFFPAGACATAKSFGEGDNATSSIFVTVFNSCPSELSSAGNTLPSSVKKDEAFFKACASR